MKHATGTRFSQYITGTGSIVLKEGVSIEDVRKLLKSQNKEKPWLAEGVDDFLVKEGVIFILASYERVLDTNDILMIFSGLRPLMASGSIDLAASKGEVCGYSTKSGSSVKAGASYALGIDVYCGEVK